jgi:hypothetical protein
MFIYLFNIFLIFFFHYLSITKKFKNFNDFLWILLLTYFFLFIGLRFEIAPDWTQYDLIYKFFVSNQIPLLSIIINHDLILYIFFIISNYLNLGNLGVNLIISLIFVISFYYYTKNFNNKFLSMAVCYSIVILSLQMGFIRQGLAFSFLLLMIYNLKLGNFFISLFFYLCAIFSHKSAIFFFFFYIFFLLSTKKNFEILKNNIFIFLFFIIALFIFFYIFFFETIERYFIHYVYFQETQAGGPLIRGFIIILNVFLFLVYVNYFKNLNKLPFYNFYNFISYVVILLFLFLFLAPLPADRFLLYMQILPIFIAGNLNYNNKVNFWFLSIIIFVNFYYLLIWLFFGINRNFYIPYQTILSLS